MVKRNVVLVAIDRATDVERTMALATGIASARGDDVHAIRVVPDGAMHVDDPAPQSTNRDGVRVRHVTLRGRPQHVIPAYARLCEASALVVERNYGSSRFWRSGRVVEAIARRSPIPLLVVPKRRSPGREASVPRRILTLIDFSPASAVALRTAVELARRHGARLSLLHTLNDPTRHITFSGGGAWEVIRRLPAQKEAAAERLRRKASYFGAHDVDTEVATGLADSAMREIARRSRPDLIVMGMAQRARLEKVPFGSTLRRVLRRTTVPVLVVPAVGGAHIWPDEQMFDQPGRRVWTDPARGRAAA